MSHMVARCSLAVDERPRAAGCAEFVLILRASGAPGHFMTCPHQFLQR